MRWTVSLFALRVPLTCVLSLALLAPLGAFSFSPLRGMLEGLFDVSPWGAFWVAIASWLSAAACWVCSLLTLNYGPRRIPGLHRAATDLEFRLFPRLALAYSLAPLALLAGVCAVSASDWPRVVAGSFAGCGAALGGWLLHRALFPGPGRLALRLSRWLQHRGGDASGYRDPATGQLLPGHWLVARFTAFFFVLWALIGLLKYYQLSEGSAMVAMPTSLTYLVLLIGLIALVLSGLTFFFDHYRVPVVLPLVTLLALASAVPTADHFVETQSTAAGTRLLQPAELLASTGTPVLVCASGGGIAAATWTAVVLANLDRQNPSRFQSSVVLFSGASGGSVGGMHFLAACRSAEGCGAAVERASRSSLDAAAWGLVGPDLLRATVPFAGSVLGDVGRGWALEQTWDPTRSLRLPLSSWVEKPAVVFNATVVETGEGIGLGNVDLGLALPGLGSLLNSTQNIDLSPVAAARLSASFPYVTPTPRVRSRAVHFADGGYYDNYGVGAAVAFLDRTYRLQTGKLPRRLLLIEIRARRSPASAGESAGGLPFLFQWWSPALTMVNVRDTEQRRRNDTTLNLLGQAMDARGVRLDRVAFEIPSDGVPLSWHLTAKQTSALVRDWRHRFDSSPETRAVSEFLAQQP